MSTSVYFQLIIIQQTGMGLHKAFPRRSYSRGRWVGRVKVSSCPWDLLNECDGVVSCYKELSPNEKESAEIWKMKDTAGIIYIHVFAPSTVEF